MAPDPTNRADVPASWLPGASQEHPKSPEYQRAVARRVKNRRWLKTVDMATTALRLRPDGHSPEQFCVSLEMAPTRWWKSLAVVSGHPSSKPPSPETRAAVIDKIRLDLADAQGQGGGGPHALTHPAGGHPAPASSHPLRVLVRCPPAGERTEGPGTSDAARDSAAPDGQRALGKCTPRCPRPFHLPHEQGES